MPDEPMTAAELRVTREFLGLTTRWLAEHLDVAERTIHRWEGGTQRVPVWARLAVEQLETDTAAVVAAAVAACEDARDPGLITYRTDSEYRHHHPGVGPVPVDGVSPTPWPASWHRALAARVAHEVPGLAMTYWTPGAGTAPTGVVSWAEIHDEHVARAGGEAATDAGKRELLAAQHQLGPAGDGS